MALMDLISFGALFIMVITIGIVVYRLSKLAQEEKKNAELKKSIYNRQIKVR